LNRELEKARKEASDLAERLAASELAASKNRDAEVEAASSDAKFREAKLSMRITDLETEIASAQSDAKKAHSARTELEKEVHILKNQLEIAKKSDSFKSAEQTTNSDGADLRYAADKPVFMKAIKSVARQNQDAEKPTSASLSAPQNSGKPTDRKVSTNSTGLAGTIQKDTELTVLDCRVLDRTTDTARINIIPDKVNASIGMPAVGDSLTLTMKTAWDVTKISCEVTWLEGTNCGVQFKAAPITTLLDKTKKSPKKTNASKSEGKSKRGSSRQKSVWS